MKSNRAGRNYFGNFAAQYQAVLITAVITMLRNVWISQSTPDRTTGAAPPKMIPPAYRCSLAPASFGLGLLATVAIVASAGPPNAGAVDTRESLVIGSLRISAYRIEKNFLKFAGSPSRPGHDLPSLPDTRTWFSRFLTRQVLTADALQSGYADRDEVQREVDRMEFHMLSHPGGLFYEDLSSRAAFPQLDVATLYERQKRIFDAEILRVPATAPLAGKIRSLMAGNPPRNWQPPMAEFMDSGEGDFLQGPMVWPFMPCEAIAEAIEAAVPGVWQLTTTTDDVYLFRIMRTRANTVSAPDTIRPALVQVARQARQRQVHLARRSQVIPVAQFSFDWAVAARMIAKIREKEPDPRLLLQPGWFPEMGDVAVASFFKDGASRRISVADYIRCYNDQFFRKLPVTAMDIYRDSQAFVMARFDYDEARRQGLHLQAKFCEDRENYRNDLALDLYEKERIRPQLNVTDEAIKSYYQEHGADFTRAIRIAGTLVVFEQAEQAQAFARSPVNEEAIRKSGQARSIEPMVLTPASNVAEGEFLPSLVFSAPGNRTVGPFPWAGAHGVWVNQKTLESGTLSLPQAAATIRQKLEQPQLEQLETELARRLCPALKIEDHIEYAKYGATAPVVKPWGK